jgi:hypothetical protein
MIGTVTLESALRSSVSLLISERRRLELECERLEREADELMSKGRTVEAMTLDERRAAARAELTAIERAEAAERAAAKAEEERRQRALLKGRAGDLARHEEARLEAIGQAEAALAAFVEAINTVLAKGDAARKVAHEIAAHRGLRLHGALSALEPKEAEARIAYAISHYLSQIKVPGRLLGGRIGSLQLPGATMHAASAKGTWAETEKARAAADMRELLSVEENGAN